MVTPKYLFRSVIFCNRWYFERTTRTAWYLILDVTLDQPPPFSALWTLVAHIHFFRSWANASLISSSFAGSFPKKARLVHSHIHWAITGKCFTHSLHSCEYIHSITRMLATELWTLGTRLRRFHRKLFRSCRPWGLLSLHAFSSRQKPLYKHLLFEFKDRGHTLRFLCTSLTSWHATNLLPCSWRTMWNHFREAR